MNTYQVSLGTRCLLLGFVLMGGLAGCTSGHEDPTPNPSPPQSIVAAPTSTPSNPPSSTVPALTPVDSGARAGANGDVTEDADNTPVSYTVAEGDKLGAIGDRFGIDLADMTKHDGSRYDYSNVIIQPGDVIGFKPWSPICRSNPASC